MKIQKISNEAFIVDGELATKIKLSISDYSRDVYLSENYCLKIGDQNINEFLVWKSLEKKDRKYFAEIVFCNNQYLVQKRYFNEDFPRNKIVVDILTNLCKKYKVDDVIKENRNYFMIGKNHPLIVDYGMEL